MRFFIIVHSAAHFYSKLQQMSYDFSMAGGKMMKQEEIGG